MLPEIVTCSRISILGDLKNYTMRAAFLGSETVKQLLGYDFTKTEDRAAYIGKLVAILFERAVQIDE